MHSKTEIGIGLALAAIPFVILFAEMDGSPHSVLTLGLSFIGIFGIWLFLRYHWWVKLALVVVYFAAFAVVDISYSVGAACKEMSREGRSCI